MVLPTKYANSVGRQGFPADFSSQVYRQDWREMLDPAIRSTPQKLIGWVVPGRLHLPQWTQIVPPVKPQRS